MNALRAKTLPTLAFAAASLLIPTAMSHPSVQAGITKSSFGTTQDGQAVDQYTLTNANGVTMKVLNYGGIVTNLMVPDREGKMGDVVLGFDNIGQYEKESPYFGAIIGRVGNRIAKGKFTLNGKEYSVPVNNGPNSLHGGIKGYDKRIWTAEPMSGPNGQSLKLTLHDPDGAEGYPGNVDVTVVYTLTPKNTVRIDYKATSDQATPINLTNHTYFNLKDGGASDILDEMVKIDADKYTPVDSTLIPTGEIASVKGTPIDFTKFKPIGQDLKAMGGDPAGFDHNLVLRSQNGKLAKAATVFDPTTGRRLEVWTTQPGVQFYTSNFLDGTVKGKNGDTYGQYHAFCLETQHYPDSINQPKFPSTVLAPGQTMHEVTEWRFSTGQRP